MKTCRIINDSPHSLRFSLGFSLRLLLLLFCLLSILSYRPDPLILESNAQDHQPSQVYDPQISKITSVKTGDLQASLDLHPTWPTPPNNHLGIPETSTRLPKRGEPLLIVTDPQVLYRLERRLHLARVIEADHLSPFDELEAPPHNQELKRRSMRYQSIVKVISKFLKNRKRKGNYTYDADKFVNRLFNIKWMSSPSATFELIAIVNRLDRRDLHRAETCGEVRLIYRLSYDHTDKSPYLYSRLPMIFNLVFTLPKPLQSSSGVEGCHSLINTWVAPHDVTDHDTYATWVYQLLTQSKGARLTFKQVELNYQSVRIPSESHPTLGGHAEYRLRVFTIDPQNPKLLRLSPLENTPDVRAIKRSPKLKAALMAEIKANLREIDLGTYVLSERFLTSKAASYSNHGIHRRTNKPFSAIFSPRDFKDLDWESTQLLKSPAALLTRLDDQSCVGCHQNQSSSGFHVLGEDRLWKSHPFNTLLVFKSPHLQRDLKRRKRYVERVLAHQEPDQLRPLSFQPLSDDIPAGAPCIQPNLATSHFKHYGHCTDGLQCEVIMKQKPKPSLEIGQCVRPEAQAIAGDACMRGTLTSSTQPRWDMIEQRRFNCPKYTCLEPVSGSPAGMCHAPCDPPTSSSTSETKSEEICAYRGSSAFDRCANKGNWNECIFASTQRGLRTACDEDTPCRNDYICQRLFEFDPQASPRVLSSYERGYCVPNYFIFQLRLDGHPHRM